MNYDEIYRDLLPPPAASPLKVLFCGFREGSTAGSWLIRGLQIAQRRSNWTAAAEPTEAQLADADLVCFVKRPNQLVQERAIALGKPIVFDTVDKWAQPEENQIAANQNEARAFFRAMFARYLPFDAHIFADRAMYEDLSVLSHHPVYIYHHSNPQLGVTPLRATASVVGYQGSERYLEGWRDTIEALCAARGLKFVVNPANYGDIDIGFAARGDEWGGYLPNKYKSNVKIANFMATGTPCLVQDSEMAYHEVADGGALFFSTPDQLERHLDALLPLPAREAARARLLESAREFHIDHIVDQFEHFFTTVRQRFAAERIDRAPPRLAEAVAAKVKAPKGSKPAKTGKTKKKKPNKAKAGKSKKLRAAA